jgi:hypothetical protein
MEEMVLKRWLELENSFRNMHAEIDSSIVPEKCIASISGMDVSLIHLRFCVIIYADGLSYIELAVWTSWSWQQ